MRESRRNCVDDSEVRSNTWIGTLQAELTICDECERSENAVAKEDVKRLRCREWPAPNYLKLVAEGEEGVPHESN